MKITANNIKLDGVRIGDVKEFQITYTEEKKMITIKYEVNAQVGRRERIISCELDEVDFYD